MGYRSNRYADDLKPTARATHGHIKTGDGVTPDEDSVTRLRFSGVLSLQILPFDRLT